MLKKIKRILYRSIENKDITYKELNKMINENNCILLDVRSKQEFDEGHLEGAINIPLYDLDKEIEKLSDKKEKIIVYCASGNRSRQAKEKLESLGYEDVYNLKDGLDGI